MKKTFLKILLAVSLLFIPALVNAEETQTVEKKETPYFIQLIQTAGSLSKALDLCSTESTSTAFSCWKFSVAPSWGKPMYNYTVWTNRNLSGCELTQVNWTFDTCKDGSLTNTYKECVEGVCKNIAHSGYNGSAKFVVKGNYSKELTCRDYKALSIVYRTIIIAAPILAILFISFDFLSSVISGDAKKISQFRSKIIRRIIALTLLLVTPALIYLLVSMLSKNQVIKNTSIISCVVKGDN